MLDENGDFRLLLYGLGCQKKESRAGGWKERDDHVSVWYIADKCKREVEAQYYGPSAAILFITAQGDIFKMETSPLSTYMHLLFIPANHVDTMSTHPPLHWITAPTFPIFFPSNYSTRLKRPSNISSRLCNFVGIRINKSNIMFSFGGTKEAEHNVAHIRHQLRR